MNEQLISIIIPVYKTEYSLLKAAIESAIYQTYENVEIILVDDGSPDECGSICDNYAKIDNRVKVLHTINQGVSAARNSGIDVSIGAYIFFLDSDDTIELNTIETLLDIQKNTSADVVGVCCNDVSDSRDSNQVKKIVSLDTNQAIELLSLNKSLYKGQEITAVWGKLYSRNILNGVKFNEKISIGEDFIFNLEVFVKASKVVYCNQRLYNYNFVSTSIMNNKSYSPKFLKSFRELTTEIQKYMMTKWEEMLMVRMINVAFSLYLRIPNRFKEEQKEIERYIKENRLVVLKNSKAKFKLRVAVLLSYISFSLDRLAFSLFDDKG